MTFLSRPPVTLLLALSACFGACRTAETAAPPTPEASVRPGANDRFLAADLDVEEYVGRFEGESREIAVQRAALADTLQLRPGEAVADVGAGTGLFMDLFAAGVGESGKVFAVELSPAFVEHLQTRAVEGGFDQVQVVHCTDRSVELAPASVDSAFICDTYHHFEYPATVMASLHRALRPGGRLVVVDFERIPGVTREWLLEHVRAGKEVFRSEIEAAGFELEDEVDVEGLAENYVLRFRRVD